MKSIFADTRNLTELKIGVEVDGRLWDCRKLIEFVPLKSTPLVIWCDMTRRITRMAYRSISNANAIQITQRQTPHFHTHPLYYGYNSLLVAPNYEYLVISYFSYL